MSNLIKIFLSLLVMNWLFPIIPVLADGNAIMRLTSAKTDYYIGEMVYVDILVEPNGEALNTVRSIIDFSNGDVLLINDFNLGTAFPYLSPGKELNNETNYINVGGFILVDSVSQNVKFGTLIFKANQVGTSTLTFSSGSHLISPDQQEKINLADCQGITINVIGEAPPPLPTPVNQPPVFQPVSNKAINLGESVSFHIEASDPENDLVNLKWDIPVGSFFNNIVNNAPTVSGDFSWTPTSQGVFNTTFTAIDSNGNSAVLTVSIGVSVFLPPVNRAPVFEPVAEKIINAGESLNFNVSATDPDNDNVFISLEPLATATLLPITTGVTATSRFNWVPQNSGIYYAVFKAKDNNINSLSSILTVRITVFGGACPPCGGGICPICQCEKIEKVSLIERPLPIITSPTHPNQDIWYSNNKPQFSWEIFEPALGFIFNLDQNPQIELDYGYLYSEEKMFSFSEVADGIWYLHLRVKYPEGFGKTVHYQVKIDTTPPEFFRPSLEGNQLYFSALDKHSGTAYFEMKIDNGNWQKVKSPLDLSGFWDEGKQLTLRAIDKAGNAIEAYVDLERKEVLTEEVQKKYVLPEFISILEPPIIDKVAFEYIHDKLFIKSYLLVSGQATPNSLITIHLSTEPETIFNSQVDKEGKWEAKLKKELKAGKYSLYATATLEEKSSLPSDKVYFSLLGKFVPEKKLYISWWILLLIIILFVLLVYLWRRDKKLEKILENFKKIYDKNKK